MRVVLVSDTHLNPRTAAFTDNWNVVAGWIEATQPDLVVHLGDIAADGASDLEELDAARAVFARLTVPMRFIPGNHDIGDNPLETGASGEHALDLARLADYRRLFDVDRWAIDAGAWQIVALNAQLFRTGTPEEEMQFRWLETRLGERDGPLGLIFTSRSSATARRTPRHTFATCRRARVGACSICSPRAIFASS